MRIAKLAKLSVAAAVLLATLSGCYMPIRFDVEIELSRAGYYNFIFDGYMAKVTLYDKLRKGEIGLASENEQAELIKTDFTRDTSTKEFEYFKQGHFKVHWEREGDLVKTKSVTFFRRNEYIFGISYNSKTGRIQAAGRSISRETKKQLNDIGLGMTGNIRIISDAKVVSHNATKVKKDKKRGGKFKIYTWKINNIFDPTPSLIIALR